MKFAKVKAWLGILTVAGALWGTGMQIKAEEQAAQTFTAAELSEASEQAAQIGLAAAADLAEATSELAALEQEILAASMELEELERVWKTLTAEFEAFEQSLELVEEEMDILESGMPEQLEKTAEEWAEQIAAAGAAVTEATARLAELTEKREMTQLTVDEAAAAYEIAEEETARLAEAAQLALAEEQEAAAELEAAEELAAAQQLAAQAAAELAAAEQAAAQAAVELAAAQQLAAEQAAAELAAAQQQAAAELAAAQPLPSPYTGTDVVNYALQFLGNPYVYGGTSLTRGVDCSGFVMKVYENFGVSLPHSSRADRRCGRDVGSLANALPGDLVCYSGHVGIDIGDGNSVHASTERTGIIITEANYRKPVAIRRIFG